VRAIPIVGALTVMLMATPPARGQPLAGRDQGPRLAGSSARPTAASARAARLPEPDDQERFLHANHLRSVSGDIAGARRVLGAIAANPATAPSLRAQAALRLAEMAELAGNRRQALSHLDQAKSLAGTGHALALEADDRRARILTAAPLSDVRGPVPGSVPLKGEAPAVSAAFRRAEHLLGSYHRVIVAPSLENINEVLRTKRRALAAAVAEYQKVASSGTTAAQVAAQFRIGAMYHHLAEAIAFESPAELLPSVALRLRRELRGESAGYLRRALGHYRGAAALQPAVPADPWRSLARREAETLGLVLGKARRASPSR
jgi:hypothetical protein